MMQRGGQNYRATLIEVGWFTKFGPWDSTLELDHTFSYDSDAL
jgi:hypothetical protein